MIGRLHRLRREVLGLNRRNHGYLFAYNPRERHHLVDDKRTTKRVLAAHGIPTAPLTAECELQGHVRALGARLALADDFVLKPARGAGGAGIVVVVGRRDGRFVKASGATLGRRDLEAHACDVIAGAYSPGGRGDVLLVEERLLPDPALATLAYRGLPDVRVLVFRGVPVLAMLRLPTRRSDARANLHLGGVGVGIDMATGRTTHAVLGHRAVTAHPDSGVALADVALPAWEEILLLTARAADAMGLGFVGVDVVVDARHGPLVLELNARPGLTIQVANRRGMRPLLDAVAGRAMPGDVAARVAFGRALGTGQLSGSKR